MALNLNISLPETTYNRLKRRAERQQQDIAELAANELAKLLRDEPIDDEPSTLMDEARKAWSDAILREQSFYEDYLHPKLKETHLGKMDSCLP